MEARLAGKGDGGEVKVGIEGTIADGDEAARADDRDEGAAVPVERVVGQVRHAIGQHCVPVGDDDPPAAHVQNRGAGLRSAIHGAERPAVVDNPVVVELPVI